MLKIYRQQKQYLRTNKSCVKTEMDGVSAGY